MEKEKTTEEVVEEPKKKDKKVSLHKVGKSANGIFADFKKFISKGNIVDLAIGVVIGAAFSAVITALVQGIIMPLITLAIPSGGIDGLVTVLNHEQALAPVGTDAAAIVVYWGVPYLKNIVNVINWGTFINALLYFLIVAIILFTIMRVYVAIKKKGDTLINAQLEKYYKKHPDERPLAPAPKPTELELLQQILDEIKANKK